MQSSWEWEQIDSFGSLRELDSFAAWMRCQITDGMAEELDAPAGVVSTVFAMPASLAWLISAHR
jgi:hypothetical protein